MLNGWALSYLNHPAEPVVGGGGGGSAPVVSLRGGVVTASDGGGCSIAFTSSGVEALTSDGVPINRFWIAPQVGMAGYEIKAVKQSGDIPSGSLLNNWLPLDTNRSWSLVGGRYGRECVLLVSIREPVSGSVLASNSYGLTAEGTGDGLS